MNRDRPRVLGAALGGLVSISVGAGAVGATALILLCPWLSMAGIVGSDIAHAVALTLIAGLGPLGARLDRVVFAWLLARRLAGRHPPRQHCRSARAQSALRFGLAGALIIVASRLVLELPGTASKPLRGKRPVFAQHAHPYRDGSLKSHSHLRRPFALCASQAVPWGHLQRSGGIFGQ